MKNTDLKDTSEAIPDTLKVCEGSLDGLDISSVVPMETLIEEIKEKPADDDRAFFDSKNRIDPLMERFISDTYTKGGLVQYGGIFWAWDTDRLFFEQITREDLRVELRLWLKRQENIKTDSVYKNIQREIERELERYRPADAPRTNPFKKIPTQVHFKNGSIKHNLQGDFEWKRREIGSTWHLKQYPLSCAPYELDLDILNENLAGKKVKIESCPYFWRVCKGIAGGDDERASQLLNYICQLIGYIFQPYKKEPFFWMFTGPQATGKTLLVDLIKQVIGESAVLERPMHEMQSGRFVMADMVGKKLYVDTDAEKTTVNGSFLKAILGSGAKSIEPKGKASIPGVKLSITAIIVGNYEPRIKDMEGVKRRAQMLKFINPVKNPDPLILEKLTGKIPGENGEARDERGVIAALGLAALASYEKRGHKIVVPEWIAADTHKWINMANTALEFIDQFNINEPNPYQIGKTELYNEYKEWCEEAGYARPLGRNSFFSEILQLDKVDERHTRGGNMFVINPNSLE